MTYAIHIVHGLLRTQPLPYEAPHTLVSDVLRETCADITLSGHDHLGYGVVKQDGRYACNPGALMRLTAAKEEITRPVQVALITLTSTECKAELIPLKSAAPGEEVLDRTKLEEQATKKQALEEFMAGLREGGDFEVFDLPAVLEKVAANQGVPARVKAEALKRLYAAIEAGGTGEEG